MNFDGASVKAPPASVKKDYAAHTTAEPAAAGVRRFKCRWRTRNLALFKDFDGEYRRTARDKTVLAKVEQYLNESGNVKVEIEESELEPEDSEVDLRFMVMNARRTKGSQASARRVRVTSWLSARCDGKED